MIIMTLATFPAGYYCLQGTESANQYPCGVGTYNPSTLGADSSSCLSCTAGSYCLTEGLSDVTSPCDGGWYCTLGAVTAQDSSNGGQCQAGYYCPAGRFMCLKSVTYVGNAVRLLNMICVYNVNIIQVYWYVKFYAIVIRIFLNTLGI